MEREDTAFLQFTGHMLTVVVRAAADAEEWASASHDFPECSTRHEFPIDSLSNGVI